MITPYFFWNRIYEFESKKLIVDLELAFIFLRFVILSNLQFIFYDLGCILQILYSYLSIICLCTKSIYALFHKNPV